MSKFSSFSNPSSYDSTSAAAASSGKSRKKKGFPAVKLSTDPQSVAARRRRHRISDRFKILQTLVPGGSKLDTVSMLEQAIQYVKFLKAQIWLHESMFNFVDVDVDDHNAAADDPAITTSSTTFLDPNNCGLHPFRDREFDSYDDIYAADRLMAESGQLDLPESWFSGEWVFN